MSDILLTERYWKVLYFTKFNQTSNLFIFWRAWSNQELFLYMLLPRDRPLLSATCLLLILKVSLIKTLIVLKSIATQVSLCVRYCLTLAVVFCENLKIEHMNCSCRRKDWIKKIVKRFPTELMILPACEKSIGVLFQWLLLLLLLLLLPLFFLFSLVRQFKCRCHLLNVLLYSFLALFLIRKKKEVSLPPLSFSLYLLYSVPNLCCPT